MGWRNLRASACGQRQHGICCGPYRCAAGSSSKLQYRNHLEACYCIGGSGSVVEPDGTEHKITEGTIYVLDEHDAHTLKGGDNEDLILVSIFNPAITGNEKHELTEDGYSSY